LTNAPDRPRHRGGVAHQPRNDHAPMPRSPVTPPPSSKRTRAPFRPRPDVELCKRGELRTERFIDAATDAFLEKGYRRASLSEIVGRAGGSLSTLYRVFG